jgi:hypothetical protein
LKAMQEILIYSSLLTKGGKVQECSSCLSTDILFLLLKYIPQNFNILSFIRKLRVIVCKLYCKYSS